MQPEPGLTGAGVALKREMEAVLRGYVERLRSDPRVPMAAGLTEVDLENHHSPFLADLAQALIVLGRSDAERDVLLRDGSQIQRVISELHGAQRAGLGWSQAALRREFEILAEEVEAGVRRAVGGTGETEDAVRLLRRLLERAERISARSLLRELASTGG